MNWQFLSNTSELLSHVLLYKNEEGKNTNPSLSFLLFLNPVNSANLVRKSLMTTKAWQLPWTVLLYKKKKMTKCLKIWKLDGVLIPQWWLCDWVFRMECLLTPGTKLLCLVNIVFPPVVYHLGCWSKTNHPVYPPCPGHTHLATKIQLRISLCSYC